VPAASIVGRGICQSPEGRRLFPRMTVIDNLRMGAYTRRDPGGVKEDMERVYQLFPRLQERSSQIAGTLAGGEQQMRAMGRAMMARPKVLLLDEPLAALDKKLRNETQFELVTLQKPLGLTFIIVTHDQQEAITMADRIGVMRDGRLMQVGPPAEIYECPTSRWIADFVGDVNLIEGQVLAADTGGLVIAAGTGGQLRAAPPVDWKSGDTVWIALRPERVQLSCEQPAASEANCMSGTVHNVAYLGEYSTCHVKLDGGFIMKAKLPNMTRTAEQRIRSADRIWLSWSADAAVVLRR